MPSLRARAPKVSPEMVGSLAGGTISGETRRKGGTTFLIMSKAHREGGGYNIPTRDVKFVKICDLNPLEKA